MCGAYFVEKDPFIDAMMEELNVYGIESRPIRAPASSIQIVTEIHDDRTLIDAKWWLLLNKDGKPNYKYATFNSRYDKLYSSNLTKGLFKRSRCIIPASGIIEGQNKKYHAIRGKDKALALGGICKHYNIDDEWITTVSIITCPGNPQLEDIHKKSIPLMLDSSDKELINMWLDNSFHDSEAFKHLLTNNIIQDLIATPIVGARNLEPRGSEILIHKH